MAAGGERRCHWRFAAGAARPRTCHTLASLPERSAPGAQADATACGVPPGAPRLGTIHPAPLLAGARCRAGRFVLPLQEHVAHGTQTHSMACCRAAALCYAEPGSLVSFTR